MSKVRHLKDEHGNCEPGCFGCKLEGFTVAPSAMGTRHPEAARAFVKDPRLDKDREAYRRLRRNGEQPRHVEGSAHLEATAETSAEVTTGLMMTEHGRDLLDTKARRRQFSEVFENQPDKPLVRTSPEQPSVLT